MEHHLCELCCIRIIVLWLSEEERKFHARAHTYACCPRAMEKLSIILRGFGRRLTSSNAAALIFRNSKLFFEAKSHVRFVLAFTQQR